MMQINQMTEEGLIKFLIIPPNYGYFIDTETFHKLRTLFTAGDAAYYIIEDYIKRRNEKL